MQRIQLVPQRWEQHIINQILGNRMKKWELQIGNHILSNQVME